MAFADTLEKVMFGFRPIHAWGESCRVACMVIVIWVYVRAVCQIFAVS